MRKKTLSVLAAAMTLALAAHGPAQAEVTEAQLLDLAKTLPEKTHISVLAIDSSTSEWSMLEKPFWEEVVPRLSDGRIDVKLSSITELGVPGSQMVTLVRSGVYNMADTVASYASENMKVLDGMDISGVAPTIEGVRASNNAFMPVVNETLSKKAGSIALASWPTTGLVLWCGAKVENLGDLKGKTVRVFSGTQADLITALGATAVSMPFAEMAPALQRGVIDCGITGTASGNIAKLPEVTKYVYALNTGWAPQIRIVNESWFKKQAPEVQEWLRLASEYFEQEMAWPTQIRNHNMGLWCTAGDERCDDSGAFKKYDATVTIPTAAELAEVAQLTQEKVLPNFARNCGEACVSDWNATIGDLVGIEMKQ